MSSYSYTWDRDSDSDDLFDGPTLRERRARWAHLDKAPQKGCKKRRRKQEEEKRIPRFGHLFAQGDARCWTMDPTKSAWWDLLQHPDTPHTS